MNCVFVWKQFVVLLIRVKSYCFGITEAFNWKNVLASVSERLVVDEQASSCGRLSETSTRSFSGKRPIRFRTECSQEEYAVSTLFTLFTQLYSENELVCHSRQSQKNHEEVVGCDHLEKCRTYTSDELHLMSEEDQIRLVCFENPFTLFRSLSCFKMTWKVLCHFDTCRSLGCRKKYVWKDFI